MQLQETRNRKNHENLDAAVCLCARCLSAVQVELAKQRQEHSHAQLLKQEVVRDTDGVQEQLNGETPTL